MARSASFSLDILAAALLCKVFGPIRRSEVAVDAVVSLQAFRHPMRQLRGDSEATHGPMPQALLQGPGVVVIAAADWPARDLLGCRIPRSHGERPILTPCHFRKGGCGRIPGIEHILKRWTACCV